TTILDESGVEAPVGVVGEIAVHSQYLPPGYWNRPELTDAKFKRLDGSACRTYFTGDLGRMRSDGCLEFVGRSDSQVKIRGQRVEIGEVESAINEYGNVREAVVRAAESSEGQTTLICYFVPAEDGPEDGLKLRRRLLARLPDFMIPAIFVRMEFLPQLAN